MAGNAALPLEDACPASRSWLRGRLHMSTTHMLPNFSKIAQSVAELLMTQRIVMLRFQGMGDILTPYAQSCGTKLYQMWGRYSPIIGAPNARSILQMYCFTFISNTNATGIKTPAKFWTFHPRKN